MSIFKRKKPYQDIENNKDGDTIVIPIENLQASTNSDIDNNNENIKAMKKIAFENNSEQEVIAEQSIEDELDMHDKQSEQDEHSNQLQELTINSYDEVKDAADLFVKHAQVILHLENLSDVERKRVLDFMSGVCYVKNGYAERIEKRSYLFASLPTQ